MKDRITKFCTHCRLHGCLAGWHVVAGLVSGKPEIYLPMAMLYALASWVDAHR